MGIGQMDRRFFLLGTAVATLPLTACSSKFRTYHGPDVTHVVVNKGERQMYLLNHRQVLQAYDVALGFAPQGHKQFRGDGRTPEGTYRIDRRNPNSKYHLSIGIDYPNRLDVEKARAMGQDPGGDIFIHGQERRFRRSKKNGDWTYGCIAVSNREMEDIYAMVRDGTPITIHP
jgi:murein L,D-transpeptidase YafK